MASNRVGNEIISWASFWSYFSREDITGKMKREMWLDLRLAQHLSGISLPAQYEVLEYAPAWVFKVPEVSKALKPGVFNLVKENSKTIVGKVIPEGKPSIKAYETILETLRGMK